jgi:hypothetical protein
VRFFKNKEISIMMLIWKQSVASVAYLAVKKSHHYGRNGRYEGFRNSFGGFYKLSHLAL